MLQSLLAHAVQQRQQPELQTDPNSEQLHSSNGMYGAVAAAELVDDPTLSEQQQADLAARLQQQWEDERSAFFAGLQDDGALLDMDDDGMDHSLADEGDDYDGADELEGAVWGSGTAQSYTAKLRAPLWTCQEQSAQIMLFQAIFLLMAWKMDYGVRDAAFTALLGMLCELLLPQVRARHPACQSIVKAKQASQACICSLSTDAHHPGMSRNLVATMVCQYCVSAQVQSSAASAGLLPMAITCGKPCRGVQQCQLQPPACFQAYGYSHGSATPLIVCLACVGVCVLLLAPLLAGQQSAPHPVFVQTDTGSERHQYL